MLHFPLAVGPCSPSIVSVPASLCSFHYLLLLALLHAVILAA